MSTAQRTLTDRHDFSEIPSNSENTIDFSAIKAKQQATWASGNYAVVGSTLQIVGENLCESVAMRSGRTVLDVAAGNGNASLAAARRFCHVVSTDYVPELLQRAKQRAEANDLPIEFKTADAESLPFDDANFDYVLSTFGVMFAPDQAKCANELLRVCRPGGKIGMANWTPESFIGQLFKTIGKYVAPPPGVQSPANWGSEDFLKQHFGQHAETIKIEKKAFCFRYLSANHWLDVFRSYYGPTLKAFNALDTEGQAKLKTEIFALIKRFNRADDGSMVVPSDYLEIVITKA